MTKYSIFFPLRAGSSRVPRKNTRNFHPDGRSLFEYKMDQLSLISDKFHEIIVSTNDHEIIEQFSKKTYSQNVKLLLRPAELCQSNTKVQDLINYAVETTSGDVIFWIHATAPFVDQDDYIEALRLYETSSIKNSNDSLMSVNVIQNFIWSGNDKSFINVDRTINPWPNTQDIKPLYEINHAFYINSRQNYLKLKDRIGLRPALYLCSGVKSIDIDWQDDFIIAQELIKLYEAGSK